MQRNAKIKFTCRVLGLFALFATMPVMAEDTTCPPSKAGGVAQGFGPFDYRDPETRKGGAAPLKLVEAGHFSIDVATLKGGVSGYLDGDIDYTLRAFPNHHRALRAMADLALREKSTKLAHMHFSVPCFFIRAKNFAPTDGMVNAVYAYYLANVNQKELAVAEAEQAANKNPNNPRVLYEAGLAYYYIGNYAKARECSAKAKSLGSAAVGLDNLLAKVK